jgi:hypothetical protein
VPGAGIGRRKSLKLFSLNLWLQSFSNSSGKLTMLIALNGHFLTQIPHPLQRASEMIALSPSTRMASIRLLTIGQKLTQSLLHFLTLHRSWSRTAILVMAKIESQHVSYKPKPPLKGKLLTIFHWPKSLPQNSH